MSPFVLHLPSWLPLAVAATFQGSVPAPTMTSPADSVSIQVALAPSPREASPTSAVLTIQVGKGASGEGAGIPGFIVQLDPPKGLRLAGDPIVEFEALHANQFLMEPWARIVTEEETEIRFTVEEGFDPASTLGINVLGYVAARESADGVTPTFIRQRLELEIKHGATGQPGDPSDSSWGPFDALPKSERPLVIGDKAPGFEGPRLNADGSMGEGALAASLGTSPLVIAMYRGHW